MRLQVLIDNNTFIDHYLLGEPAASYYIEEGDKRILFDTGYSDAFIYNAQKLGINLNQLTHIILSHGHNDHTGGLKYLKEQYDLKNVKLIAHPGCFAYREERGLNISSPVTEEEMCDLCEMDLSREPVWLDEDCVFLGEIPVRMPYEARKRIGRQRVKGVWEDDYVVEDSAIACRTKEGLFIITGCSHSGICNIVEQAKAVCKEEKIAGIIGGFHLFQTDIRLEKTIEYLSDTGVERLYPCHCVSFAVKAKMNEVLSVKETGSGLIIEA